MKKLFDLTIIGVSGISLKQFIHGRINGELSFYLPWETIQIIEFLKERDELTKEFAPYTIIDADDRFYDPSESGRLYQLIDKNGCDATGECITMEDAIQTSRGLYTLDILPQEEWESYHEQEN